MNRIRQLKLLWPYKQQEKIEEYQNMRTIFGLITVGLFLIMTQAEANTACNPVKFVMQNKNTLLPGPTQTHSAQIYFFKNNSSQGIWIDHPTPHRSASAGWSSYLEANHWSALLLNRNNFAISCATINPGKVEYQNCATVLSICSPNVKSISPKLTGTIWLAEDLTWDALLSKVKKRSVQLMTS